MKTHQILSSIIPTALLLATKKLVLIILRPWVKMKLKGQTKLHLACGDNILAGWANIDLKIRKNVIVWDLTEPLPADFESVELIYCEHFIEHIPLKQATNLLNDCFRTLKPNGVLRFSTPNLKKLIDEYLLGQTSEWHDVGWKPLTPCQMVNESFRLWGHQFIYDADELKRILEAAGFRKVTQVAWRDSMTPGLTNLECRPFHGEIIIEAIK